VQLALAHLRHRPALHEILGVNQSQVSRWRSGDGVPSQPGPLAALLGVPEAMLVYGPTDALAAYLEAQRPEAGL
jgi:hypothetical protein